MDHPLVDPDLPGLLDRLRWQVEDANLLPDMNRARAAIAGLPGAGQRELANSLWGWEVLSPQALTHEAVQDFGLFTLVDLPKDPFEAESTLFRLEGIDLVIYLLAGELRPSDFRWIARLRAAGSTLLPVWNLAATLESSASVLTGIEQRLSMPVLPVNVCDPEEVGRELLPAILKACPSLDVPLAGELAGLRRQVAGRLIVQSMITSALVSLEPVPLVDVSVLVGLQMRLLNHIAAVYGYRQPGSQRREIMVSASMGLLLRFAGQTLAKAVPLAGWLISALIGASATWVVGRTAMAFYGAEFPALGRWLLARWEQVRDGLPRRTSR